MNKSEINKNRAVAATTGENESIATVIPKQVNKLIDEIRFSDIKNNKEVIGSKSIYDYIDIIKNGSPQIKLYRENLALNIDAVKATKNKMAAITPAGLFDKVRANETLLKYSNIVCCDIDKISDQKRDIDNLKAELSRDKFVMIVHKSLSGNGLAVFVKVDSGAELHSSAYAQVADYISKKYSVQVDPSCKDIARMRYLSYDPDCYFNPTSEHFEVGDPALFDLLIDQINFTERLQKMEDGSRNVFLHQLACNCARSGVNEIQLLKYCIRTYSQKDFDAKEIRNTINSAFRSVGKSEGKNIQDRAKVQKCNNADVHLPSTLYGILPKFFEGFNKISQFNSERDIVLLSTLGMFSSILSCHGIYRGLKVYANFYLLISAPAANSKGRIALVRQLADPVDDYLKKMCEDQLRDYRRACANCRQNECDDEPTKPECRGLFIPANSSNAALTKSLKLSKYSLVIDTEADVFSQSRDHTWAELDTSYRKAFHHELISSNRIEGGQTEVKEPRISLVLTGTPNQVLKLSESIENGLVSRLMIYSFTAPNIWDDPFDESNDAIPDFIDQKSKAVLDIFHFNERYPFVFKLSENQRKKHFDAFSKANNDLDLNDPFIASIRRQGLFVFRAAMTISAIERCEQNITDKIQICSDLAFEAAMAIYDVLKYHNRNLYDTLSTELDTKIEKNEEEKIYHEISSIFTTRQFVSVALKYNRKERSAKSLLGKLLVSGKVIKLTHGNYQKVNGAQLH